MEHTEGVDIFNTILSDAEINFDHNIDGKLPRAFGGESERDFSFTQSIYPGQTYKAVINSDHGRYTYETKTPVGNNAVINHKNPTIIINQNNNTKNSFTEDQVKNIVRKPWGDVGIGATASVLGRRDRQRRSGNGWKEPQPSTVVPARDENDGADRST